MLLQSTQKSVYFTGYKKHARQMMAVVVDTFVQFSKVLPDFLCHLGLHCFDFHHESFLSNPQELEDEVGMPFPFWVSTTKTKLQGIKSCDLASHPISSLKLYEQLMMSTERRDLWAYQMGSISLSTSYVHTISLPLFFILYLLSTLQIIKSCFIHAS